MEPSEKPNNADIKVDSALPVHAKEALGLQLGDEVVWTDAPRRVLGTDGRWRIAVEPGMRGRVLSVHEGSNIKPDSVGWGTPAWAIVRFGNDGSSTEGFGGASPQADPHGLSLIASLWTSLCRSGEVLSLLGEWQRGSHPAGNMVHPSSGLSIGDNVEVNHS